MKIHLTFDVEVWCNDWSRLDERFPKAFDRYVFGRSARGAFALPKTLEILDRHGLTGVFFVEPLFSARFGSEHLQTITSLISAAGQDVQLHLHTEWVDELPTPPIQDHHRKRQHLSYYDLDEQRALVAYGLELLRRVGVERPRAFRAGSFACNADTFRALRSNDIAIDSSLNACDPVSGIDLVGRGLHDRPAMIEGVYSVPVAVYRDGFGRRRSAQINGSGLAELVQAIETAAESGASEFVIVSHNFEMLKPGASEPDPIVVRRFERFCEYLGRHRRELPTERFALPSSMPPASGPGTTMSSVGPMATLVRHAEQIRRRLLA